MPPMAADDPTIPDRLILRALIEDGLPSKAALENWPIREPWEIARAIFDCVYRCPYEQKLTEPVFENISKSRLKKALVMGLDVHGRLLRGSVTLWQLFFLDPQEYLPPVHPEQYQP